MLKWHQIQGLAGQANQLVSQGMRDKWKEMGVKEKSSYQLKSPSI